MNIDDLMQQLGEELNLPNFRLDDNGVCRLMFEGPTIVDLEYEQETSILYVYSVLARIPNEGRENVYEQLLAANLFSRQTAGNVLGIALEEGEILLTRAVPIEKVEFFDEFTKILSAFIELAKYWAAQLANNGMNCKTEAITDSEFSELADGTYLRA